MSSVILFPRRGSIFVHVSRLALSFTISLLIFSNAIIKVEAALSTCYDPSGDKRPDTPCFPNAAGSSTCCGSGWVCTNTTLCVAGPTVKLNPGDGQYFEGSCTDKTWNSAGCPSYCRSPELAGNIANGVYDCGNGYYCCSEPAFGLSDACCRNSTVQFFLGNYVNMTTIGGSIGPGEATTSASLTSTSSTSSPASASASTTPSTSSTSSPAPSTSGALSTGAKAGIAIAVILGVAAVAGISFLLFRKRRNTRQLNEQFESMQHQNPKLQYAQGQDSIPHNSGDPVEMFAPSQPKPYELHDGSPAIHMAELQAGQK